MAWQLHYTSARSAERSGFQFTAASPGLPPGAEAVVSPYLGYRPPPEAPPAPDAAQLAAFPVALCYDAVGGRRLLVLSRYLGRDYSGRFGNFLAHAVLAEAEELEGLRPIEFWRASFWSSAPAALLPLLEDPPPGDAFDPAALGEWLAALDHDPYGRLAWLLDHTGDRIILVCPDVEEIARWFAVLSYSLPVEAAAALSFTTYTADPVTSPHRLVGTTPDVWAEQRTDHPAHPLDAPAPPHTPSRYAAAVVARWRAHDLDGLDALAELARLAPDSLDGAAVLRDLCDGGTPGHDAQKPVLPLLRHPDLPPWVWERLDIDALGFDLAAAVNRHSPDPAAARAAGDRCAHLVLTTPSLRDRLAEFSLEDPAELSVALSRELASATSLPSLADLTVIAERLAIPVMSELTRRTAHRLALRLPAPAQPGGAEGASEAVLEALERVCASARGPLLTGAVEALEHGGERVRRAALTAAVCERLAELADEAPLAESPQVALWVLRALAERHGVHGAVTLKFAERLPGHPAARGVLAARDVATGRDPKAAARALERVGGALAEPTLVAVADALTERSPRYRAALLAALDPRVGERLARHWIATAQTRARRFELVGVALRAPGTVLDGWARELTRRRITMLQLETYFRDDQTLRAALRELRG